MGADSLRQAMVHPDTAPQTSATANDTLSATTSRFLSANGVYANDKHKLCTDRCENGVHRHWSHLYHQTPTRGP